MESRAGLMCLKITDKELPKSRRQQKAEKAAPKNDEYIPPRKENDLKRKREEAEQDPKLKEFLDVYQAPSKTSIWANGETQGVDVNTSAEETVQAVAVPEPEDESDDEYQVIAKKPKTAPEPTAEAVDQASVPQDNPAMGVEEAAADAGDAMEDVQNEPAGEQGPVSDADWLRSRTNRVLELVEDDEVPPKAMHSDEPPPPQPKVVKHASPEATVDYVESQQQVEPPETQADDAAPSEEEENKIRETGRLYLRNLHFEVTEEELREQFSKHGALEEVSSAFSYLMKLPMQ
ncbi:Multiple RNA-binding domain-containing protein 1 [Neocucurbitaria cava]|uniref:Multiple RNA-binding domain-containing protein 1 n=1 Tax=Neocucurbitaria cava TaxID=798079 RepID=A0A9W8Y3J0_9PLEO|nr:Multiple RNA-binding domain-containing protein 1 [Neocucurbitaria cava]